MTGFAVVKGRGKATTRPISAEIEVDVPASFEFSLNGGNTVTIVCTLSDSSDAQKWYDGAKRQLDKGNGIINLHVSAAG